jgi:hypothetical protein
MFGLQSQSPAGASITRGKKLVVLIGQRKTLGEGGQEQQNREPFFWVVGEGDDGKLNETSTGINSNGQAPARRLIHRPGRENEAWCRSLAGIG